MNKQNIIGSVAQYYPDEVRDFVLSLMVVLVNGIPEEDMDPCLIERYMCDLALERFLGDGNLYFEEEELRSLINKAMANTIVNDLIDKGLIDTIENENGEEVVWITEKGKAIADYYEGLYKPNN